MVQIEQWAWQTEELQTVNSHFQSACNRFPDRTAQLFNPDLYAGDCNGKMSWTQLRDRVDSIGYGLMSLGLLKQEKIAIMAPSSPYWTHADMAISSCGAVSVTIYPTLSASETSYIINDSSCRFLFVGSEELLSKIIGCFDTMSSLEKIIVMSRDYRGSDPRVLGLTELIEAGGKWGMQHHEEYHQRRQDVTLDDTYTILYTSGTTGRSKGVVLSHRNVSSRMSGVGEYFQNNKMELDETDVGLCFLPLSHIFERGSLQMMAIMNGSTIAYADKPGTLLKDMQKYNPTWINCVPRLYEKIYITFQQQMSENASRKRVFGWAFKVGTKALQYRRDENGTYNMSPDFDLKSKLPLLLRLQYTVADKLFAKVRALFGSRFKYAFSASAGIAPQLLEFYYTLGFAVCEGYGSTESFNACILNPITHCKPGYIGQNANGSWTRIAEDGELEISGAGVFKEYLNKPEATTKSFTEDGWFRTGDIVSLSKDGYYKMVDRKKAILCTSTGKKVAPAKIENYFSTSSVIEQLFLIGDDRSCITALIVPSFGYFINHFKKNGIPYSSSELIWSDSTGIDICMSVGDDFITNRELTNTITKEIDQVNEQLESFEKIKNFVILRERFSEDNGQLTPTQKTKKTAIIESYSSHIERMYEGKLPA